MLLVVSSAMNSSRRRSRCTHLKLSLSFSFSANSPVEIRSLFRGHGLDDSALLCCSAFCFSVFPAKGSKLEQAKPEQATKKEEEEGVFKCLCVICLLGSPEKKMKNKKREKPKKEKKKK